MTPSGGDFDVVTGAFSYSGAAIASELRAVGRRVRTLTGHPGRAPEGTSIEVRPLDFADPAGLAASLRGARALFNTYWVRFAHGQVSHETAVAQSRVLFQAAAEAGVSRVVHVSITHPSADSPYPYFRGKAAVGSRSQVVRVPGSLIPPAARLLGLALRDTLLTSDEYQAMADGLADTDGPATGETSLTQWITDHKGTLGRTYANELDRHFR